MLAFLFLSPEFCKLLFRFFYIGRESVPIKPLGVGVVVEARHLCMMMRGVEKRHSSTITSSMLGAFREKETRDEFLSLIQAKPSVF